jgi:hypothetical protein
MASCMSKQRVFYFLLLLLVISVGCKTKKNVSQKSLPDIAKPTATDLLIGKIKENENTFDYYSARGKVHYKDPSNDQDLDVAIVMEKDKYIWMNVTALLGIEAARIKITPDSIIILDRLHRKCIVADYSYIKKLTNADLKLEQLQRLLIGNATFSPDEKQSIVDTVLSNIVIYTFTHSQKQTTFYSNSLKLTKSTLEDKTLNRQFNAEYANTYIHGTNAFPSEVNINIRAEKNVECSFRLSNFAFEKKKEASFSIPSNYEIVKP